MGLVGLLRSGAYSNGAPSGRKDFAGEAFLFDSSGNLLQTLGGSTGPSAFGFGLGKRRRRDLSVGVNLENLFSREFRGLVHRCEFKVSSNPSFWSSIDASLGPYNLR